MSVLRIASVGTSAIMRVMQEAISLTDGAEAVLVYSRDEKRGREFADSVGVKRSTADFDELLNDKEANAVYIASPNAESCELAKKFIDEIIFVPEVGQLYYGRVVSYLTSKQNNAQLGAFIELAPGKDGLCHISKVCDKRIDKVEDVLKIGDMTWVKVVEIDEKGRINLSRKDALKEVAEREANGEIVG